MLSLELLDATGPTTTVAGTEGRATQTTEPRIVSHEEGMEGEEGSIDASESETVYSIPKWSAASNAFDPDSEEFWNADDVVYEAFVDDGPQSPSYSPATSSNSSAVSLGLGIEMERARERLDEEDRLEEEERESLVASGNESRRRRRENFAANAAGIASANANWVVLEMDPSPAHDSQPSAAGSGPFTFSTMSREAVIDLLRQLQSSTPSRRPAANTRPGDVATIPQRRGEFQPAEPLSDWSINPPSDWGRENENGNRASEMFSDLGHRTASPMPFFSFGEATANTTTATTTTTTTTPTPRHRRRESQPAPTTNTLLFT